MTSADHRGPRWADFAAERLAGPGRRRGDAREALVELLDRQDCGLSAAEIRELLEDEGRTVARASIYRILDELEAVGLVARIEVGQGLTRFEAQYPDGTHHHHHLICDGCGDLVPFRDEELERTIRRVSHRLPFEVNEHEITLRGECPQCAEPAHS